jgi:chloramphenicol 3-O-phosphotransferase
VNMEAIAPTRLAAPLDNYLREVVQTLQAAVTQGMRRAAEDPTAARPQLADCEDILRVIMAGDVNEWIGGS